MSPELLPFLDQPIHIDCHDLNLCADSVLRIEGDALVLSPQGLRLPLTDARFLAEPEIGPREWADFPDLFIYVRDLVIKVFKVLRDPDFHEEDPLCLAA